MAHARLLHAAIPGAGAAELATSSSDRAVTSGRMLLGRRSGWAGALFCSNSVGGCEKPKHRRFPQSIGVPLPVLIMVYARRQIGFEAPVLRAGRQADRQRPVLTEKTHI